MKSEHHGNTGGRDLTDLRHYGVHQAGGRQVVDEVEEAERALVSPVGQLAGTAWPGLQQVLGVEELVIHKTVRLNSLSELVSLTAHYNWLVAAFRQ